MDKMRPLEPVQVLDLFPDERAALLELLRGLSPEQWDAPTVCPGWSAKDIALHLLGDNIGVLSRGRDRALGTFVGSWDDLLAFINRTNEQWVEATRRISHRLLCELLEFTGGLLDEHFRSLDLNAIGGIVSWAGPDPAPVWLDVAREYTERWLHQQQVRDAVSAPPLTKPRLFAPVLATFVRALPHTYRDVHAPDGTLLRLTVTGAAGGVWYLLREAGTWRLGADADGEPHAAITLEQDAAWRLWTRGLTPDASGATLSGDIGLAKTALEMISIIA
jgi:uncharacterized protein (TIGR03083 family)